MMLPLLITPALLLSAQGPGQRPPARPQIPKKPLPPVEAPGTKGWVRAGITPEQMVKRADARMNGLKNAIAEWAMTANLPNGRGRSFGRSVMYGPGRFRIEIARINTRKEDGLQKLIWTNTRAGARVLTTDGWNLRPGFRTLVTPLAPAFLTSPDDVLMRSTQGAKSMTTLLASARKLGYTAIVERRKYAVESDLRLVLSKPNRRYAISWNEKRTLPSQIEVESTEVKGVLTRILWSCAWGVKGSPLTADDIKNYHPSSLGN